MIPVKILSVNISEKKGTVKKPVLSINLNEYGVELDAHAGEWHRQVSMLSEESISKFEQQAGRKINFGEFAENLTISGMNLMHSKPLSRFEFGNIILEVTQIGKKCHGDSCAIFREVGNCVMPKEGIFCRVVRGGKMSPGMEGFYIPKKFRVKIITMSDRASRGIYEDRSGPRIGEFVNGFFEKTGWDADISTTVLPDDAPLLENNLTEFIKTSDIIFTTGGTGIGPKDITPEVVKPLLDREIPGIMEMIRIKYGMQKSAALLSRGVAGISGGCLIFTLPGSVRAVEEYMTEINGMLEHLIYMQYGLDTH